MRGVCLWTCRPEWACPTPLPDVLPIICSLFDPPEEIASTGRILNFHLGDLGAEVAPGPRPESGSKGTANHSTEDVE